MLVPGATGHTNTSQRSSCRTVRSGSGTPLSTAHVFGGGSPAGARNPVASNPTARWESSYTTAAVVRGPRGERGFDCMMRARVVNVNRAGSHPAGRIYEENASAPRRRRYAVQRIWPRTTQDDNVLRSNSGCGMVWRDVPHCLSNQDARSPSGPGHRDGLTMGTFCAWENASLNCAGVVTLSGWAACTTRCAR